MIDYNKEEIKLNNGEQLHDLQINNLFLIQRTDGYCFTSDSVLLANFVKSKKTQTLVELCAGSGVVSILVSAKNEYKKIYAIEIQKSLADLCERNFILNKIQNTQTICTSVQESLKYINAESVDIIYCNPPFFKKEMLTSLNLEKAIARKEIYITLEELITTCSKLLKFGGCLYLVYQTERMGELIEALTKNNLQPKELQLVQPKINKNSNIFLIKAVKGGKSGLKALPTLTMYTELNEETEDLKKIYQRKKKY